MFRGKATPSLSEGFFPPSSLPGGSRQGGTCPGDGHLFRLLSLLFVLFAVSPSPQLPAAPSPARRRSSWAPLHSDENPSAAAPSRMPPAPLLSPSPTQLTLPRARLRRTRGIKCTLGAQRNEHKKTHAPRHQFIFTLATPSGISRSCSHLLKSPQNPCRLGSISEPRIQDNKGNSSPAY